MSGKDKEFQPANFQLITSWDKCCDKLQSKKGTL